MSNFDPIRLRIRPAGAKLNRALVCAVFTAFALPAMASREVDSLRIVPMIFGRLVDMIGQMLIVSAVFSVVLVPLLIWIGRRAGRAHNTPVDPRMPRIISLHESGESRSLATDASQDEQQRQAELKAQAEAIELRPRASATANVDDETRKRIAAAVKRLEAGSEDRVDRTKTDNL